MACQRASLRRLAAGLALALCAVAGANASGFSSSSSSATSQAQLAPEQVIPFSKRVEKALAAEGALVALVARIGRPPADMPEGMRYTHVGFAVYSTITTRDGRRLQGYAMHNLYQRDDHPEVSELVQDYPADFFAAVARLEAGVAIPSPALQKRLLQVIESPAYKALHDPHYSLIANPYTLGRQNCTEFVLDVLHAAITGTGDLQVLKARTREDFRAQPVKVSPLKLAFGALFSAEVSLSDQPGPPETATFETLADFLLRNDPGSKVLTVLPE